MIRSFSSPKLAQVRQETDRIQSLLRSTYDSKIEAAMKMINELQASVIANEKKVDKLTAENDKLSSEMKMMKPAKQINIGQPDEDSRKSHHLSITVEVPIYLPLLKLQFRGTQHFLLLTPDIAWNTEFDRVILK